MRDDVFTPLEEVLRRVEFDRAELGYVERRRITEAGWAQLEGAGLVRRIEDAEWAHCTGCGEAEDVHFMPNSPEPYPYIWCQDLGLLRVEPERLQQWKPDVARLAEMLATAFSCAGRVEELVPGRIWLLGRTVIGGRPREVFFGRQLAGHDGAAVVGGCRRFLAGVAPVVLIAGVIPERATWGGDPPPVLALPSAVTLEGGQIVADRAYVESACFDGDARVRDASPVPTATFGSPPGTEWSDVELRVRDGESLSVRVRNERRCVTYVEMGMADSRTSRPDKQWELLQIYAARRGVLTWDRNSDAARRNKKRTERLAAALRAYFDLPGDPIEYVKATKGWRTRFAALPE